MVGSVVFVITQNICLQDACESLSFRYVCPHTGWSSGMETHGFSFLWLYGTSFTNCYHLNIVCLYGDISSQGDLRAVSLLLTVPEKGNVDAPSQLQDKKVWHFWSWRLWCKVVTNTENKQCLPNALAVPLYRTTVGEKKELFGVTGKNALFLQTTLSLKNLKFRTDVGAEEKSGFSLTLFGKWKHFVLCTIMVLS